MVDLQALDPRTLRATDPAAMTEIAARMLDQLSAQSRQIQQHQDAVQRCEREIKFNDAKLEKVTFELARLKAWKFDARTERMNAGQRQMFEDTAAEDEADLQAQLDALLGPASPPADNEKAKRAPCRQKLPENLRRVEHRHEPANTTCCCGTPMQRVGEDVSERLDIIPAEFIVHRHVRGKWACRCCQTLVQEPVAPQVVDKGQPTAGLVAHTRVSRFVAGRVVSCVVFRVQIDAGGADVGVPQVVAHHLEVGLLAQMAARRVAHPVCRCALDVCGARFELGSLFSQAGRGQMYHLLDDGAQGAARHRLAMPDQRNHQGRAFARRWQRRQTVFLAIPDEFFHQLTSGRHQAILTALAGDLRPPAVSPVCAALAGEISHGRSADLRNPQASQVEQREQPPASRGVKLLASDVRGHSLNSVLHGLPLLLRQEAAHARRGRPALAPAQGQGVASQVSRLHQPGQHGVEDGERLALAGLAQQKVSTSATRALAFVRAP